MAVVMVEIRPKHPAPEPTTPTRELVVAEPDGVEVVADMDDYLEHAVCSCSAGDDNPY